MNTIKKTILIIIICNVYSLRSVNDPIDNNTVKPKSASDTSVLSTLWSLTTNPTTGVILGAIGVKLINTATPHIYSYAQYLYLLWLTPEEREAYIAKEKEANLEKTLNLKILAQKIKEYEHPEYTELVIKEKKLRLQSWANEVKQDKQKLELNSAVDKNNQIIVLQNQSTDLIPLIKSADDKEEAEILLDKAILEFMKKQSTPKE